MTEKTNSNTGRIKVAVRAAIVILLLFAGVEHLLNPTLFERAMPDWIPMHHDLVLFTGLCELAGAAGLVIAKLRLAVTVALVVFLVAVFPVNINMAVNPDLFPSIPPAILWVRLPLQALLIAAVIWSSKS